jgi:hypothetical protein
MNAMTKKANKYHISPRGFNKRGVRVNVRAIRLNPKINDSENTPKSRKISVALININSIRVC